MLSKYVEQPKMKKLENTFSLHLIIFVSHLIYTLERLELFGFLFFIVLAGVERIGILNLWARSRRSFSALSVKKMAWGLDNPDGTAETKKATVSPAAEDYAQEAIEAIRAGKVIAVPTDTLYGFACDAWYASTFLFII